MKVGKRTLPPGTPWVEKATRLPRPKGVASTIPVCWGGVSDVEDPTTLLWLEALEDDRLRVRIGPRDDTGTTGTVCTLDWLSIAYLLQCLAELNMSHHCGTGLIHWSGEPEP